MDATKTKKLTALSRRQTAYEVTAAHADYPHILIGYTPRKSFAGLVDAVRNSGGKFFDITGCDEWVREGQKIVFANGWAIRFGRTQRQAIINGECRHRISELTSLEDIWN